MPGPDVFARVEQDILCVLPGRRHDLSRLRMLAESSAPDGPAAVTVTVIGKYNHGKSRLLNELIGCDAFAVADRRETVRLGQHRQDRLRWLDAPGLDADVAGGDDGLAHEAVWLQSDIRLFVHSAKAGELDARERQWLQGLHADAQHSRRQTLLVISQIDQLDDDTQLHTVMSAIGAQAAGAALHAVSATRHRQGVQGGKRLLVERSGIPGLRQALEQAVARVPLARAHESARLLDGMGEELGQRHAGQHARLEALLQRQAGQRRQFDDDLQAVFDKAREGLADVLSTPGPDLALRPDCADDRFRLTVGRAERARVQVAYSRVCIRINAMLTRHGAHELPAAQHTVARSLNSVMVAVLGVSAKYREDLRRMFDEAAGRERLMRDFARYYEISADRLALAGEVEALRRDQAAVGAAQAALRLLAGTA